MKKIIITAMMAMASVFAIAQHDTTVTTNSTSTPWQTKTVTTTTVKNGDSIVSVTKDIDIERRGGWSVEDNNGNRDRNSFNSHLGGTFLGWNNYLSDGSRDTPADAPWMELRGGRSMSLDLYWDPFSIPSITRWFAIEAGVDLEFNHYAFKKSFNLANNDGTLIADYDNVPEKGFKRMNLRTIYAGIPLMMEFQMRNNNNKPIYLTAGIKGQVRIGSRTKQIWKEDGDRQKNKTKDDFNTNLFRYSLIGGIGYGQIQFFGEYCPVSIFRDGKGPQLQTFSIGVKFNINS